MMYTFNSLAVHVGLVNLKGLNEDLKVDSYHRGSLDSVSADYFIYVLYLF